MTEKVKLSLNMHNLEFLSAFSSSPELKARLKNDLIMLKQKARENWGVDVDSQEYKEMWKMTHWVSSDPAMAEKIRRAVDITTQVKGMSVEIELAREEVEDLIKSVEGKYFPNDELPILKKALETF